MDDLDDYTLLSIFDKLNLDDLINVADIGLRYRHLVTRHYAIPKFKLHDSLIRLAGHMLAGSSFEISSYSIEIVTFPVAQKMLRIFGHLISKLEFNYDRYNPAQARIIAKYINDYCSESLVEIKLYSFKESVLDLWNIPFTKVENVYLIRGIFTSKPFDLNSTFPAMQRLELEWITITESKYLVKHYPHLKYFKMADSKTIERILSLNHQIQSVYVWSEYSFDFLRFICENSTNLSELILNGLPKGFTETTIQRNYSMPNIKKFTLYLSNLIEFIPEYSPFDLGQVEEFTLSCIEPSQKWIDIITQYQSIRKLAVEWGILNSNQWSKVLRDLPNLMEIEAKLDSTLPTQSITALINNSTKLEKVTFLDTESSFRDILRTEINEQWQLFVTIDRNFADAIFIRSVEKGRSWFTNSWKIIIFCF